MVTSWIYGMVRMVDGGRKKRVKWKVVLRSMLAIEISFVRDIIILIVCICTCSTNNTVYGKQII